MRFRAYHIQNDILKLYCDFKNRTKTDRKVQYRGDITVAQSWNLHQADKPPSVVPEPRPGRHTIPNGSSIVTPTGGNRVVSWVKYTKFNTRQIGYFSLVSKCDRVALFTVGATAPTTNMQWWKSLAEKYSHNTKKAKLVVFETHESPLVQGGYYEDIRGGYYSCEFDLTTLGKHLREKKQVPEPYATLTNIWKQASMFRRKFKKLYKEKAQWEGHGWHRHPGYTRHGRHGCPGLRK